LEDLRTQLLNLTDAVQQMGALAPSGVADMSGLQQARSQIQQMPYKQLNTLRQGLSSSKLKARLDPARAQLSAYTGGQAQGAVSAPNGSSKLSAKFTDSTPFPSPAGFCNSNTLTSAVNNSSGSIGATGGSGTPPSVRTGTVNTGSDTSLQQDPSHLRIPTGVFLAADAIRFTADAIREFSQDACKEEILGFNASLVCIAVDALWVIADAIDEGIHFCDDDLTANVIDTSYNGLVDVHTDLLSVDGDVVAANTDIDTRITNANTDIDTRITNTDTDIDTRITNLDTHLTNVNTDIDTRITNLSTLVTTLIANLSSQVGAATQQLTAGEQEIMKLLLTPDGLKVLNLAILSCNGSTQPCPAVLATCLANKNCSFNNEGPLP
jgi:hypothetical protein